MSRAVMQSSNIDQLQNDTFACQENGQRYPTMNNVSLRTSTEMSYEQLLAYYNATAHLINYNYGQPVVHSQQ
jgi:hypothetical protein